MSDTLTPTQVEEQKQNNAATQPPADEVDQATGKKVYTYQPKDAEGQAFGKPYRFLYTDHADLVNQLTSAKENGDRYIHEVKTGKRQLQGEAAQPKPDFKTVEATEEADKVRRAQVRKDLEDEIGAPLESVKARLKYADEVREYWICRDWAMAKQDDGYVVCVENSKKMLKFITDNNLALNATNLDTAFEELKDKLMLKKAEETGKKDATDSPSAPATKEKVTPTASKPASGVRPGQFEGRAPSTSTDQQPLTAKRYREITLMSLSEFKKLLRTNRKEYDAFIEMKSKRATA